MKKLNLKSDIFKEATINLAYLGLTQTINYIIPILLIPHLTNTVGIENFGRISIIQAILFYGIFIVNYGFNYSGTIEVSVEKTKDHSALFSSITYTKICLALLSSLLAFSLVLFFKLSYTEISIVYLSFFFHLMGQSLYPEWFFHGIQKLKYSFYVILSWKIVYVVSVLFFVKRQDDYLFVVFADGVLCVFTGIVSLVFVREKYGIKFKVISLSIVKNQLIKNWHLFSSMVFTTFYTKGNFLFLGLCSNQIEVAIYAIAERYVFMINGLLSLLNRIVLPYLSLYKQKSTVHYIRLVKASLYVTVAIGVILCVSNLLLSNYIARLLNISFQKELSHLLSLLAFSFISSSFCTFATTVLITENESKLINRFNIIGLLIGLFFVTPLTFFYKGIGLSIGFICNSYILVILNTWALFKLKNTLSTTIA